MCTGSLCRLSVVVVALAATASPTSTAFAQTARVTSTLILPAKDQGLQRQLNAVLAEAPFRRLLAQKRLSVALVDLSDLNHIRYAGIDDDRMRYAASLPKIAILLGAFDQIEKGKLTYTPALRTKMELMIRRSTNRESTELIKLVGFQNIATTLRNPEYELYSAKRNGGLWVGRDYGGWIGVWRRDPMHNLSHGATARQVARFFVMLDQGTLVSPWASAEMKSILAHPEINHKFVLGLQDRPTSSIFRKSGTWKQWHADAALVERDGKKYVAVALLESQNAKGVLSSLIVKLDDIIHQAPSPAFNASQVPSVLEDLLGSPLDAKMSGGEHDF